MTARIRLTDGTEFNAANGAWELHGDVLHHRFSYRSGADPTTQLVTVRYSPSAWYSITESEPQRIRADAL